MAILVPTAYLPSIKYMACVCNSDATVIEAFESYAKQTSRNHCYIYGPNGRQTLSIPVTKINGNHTLTREMVISDHQPWQTIHWRSIETAYRNSPFFLYYQDDLVSFYEKRFKYLLDFNTELLQSLLRMVQGNVRVSFTEQYEKNQPELTDLRPVFEKKNEAVAPDFPSYIQVFEPRHGFLPNLSIIDAIFNLGPDTPSFLKSLI